MKVLPNTVDARFRPEPKLPGLLDRYGVRGKQVLLTVSRLRVRNDTKAMIG